MVVGVSLHSSECQSSSLVNYIYKLLSIKAIHVALCIVGESVEITASVIWLWRYCYKNM